ncbi:hypothetical protein [Streptomyces sp. NPDC059176]|uniref:hypothetical protein n=1 Tax=unclassified Streptomyces TaxID=2593676 RepID=UPI00368082C5
MALNDARRYRWPAALSTAVLFAVTGCAGTPAAPPDETAAKALDSVRTASSVHLRLHQDGPEAMSVDLDVDRAGKCAGRITTADGTVQVIKVAEEWWIKPDERFWQTHFGAPGGGRAGTVRGAVPEPYRDRFLHGGAEDEQPGGMAALCDLKGLHTTLAEEVGAGPFTAGAPVVVDRTRAETVTGRGGRVQIRVVDGGRPHAVSVVQRGRTTVTTTFTDWDAPVRAAAPASGSSVDIGQVNGH